MSETQLKKHAYMAIVKNEKGVTMISMLIAITIIFISLPFLAYLLSSLSYSSHQELISVNQFFLFLRDELVESSQIKVANSSSIIYELENGNEVTFSKYNDLIRRQVDRKGHEIYLREVKALQFTEHPHGIVIKVTTNRGEVYEKTFMSLH